MSPHSRQALAQASQTSAQSPHICGEWADSYCIKATQVWQVSIQVRQSFSHIAQSQPVTHSRQACRQAVQASMQAAFLAESIVFSAASVDEPVMATAKAAADNNMVMERNMVFSFSNREASSVVSIDVEADSGRISCRWHTQRQTRTKLPCDSIPPDAVENPHWPL